MLHIPTVVCLAHGQDQLEMGDNCSSEENHISLVQASQIPVKTIKISLTSLNSKNVVKFENDTTTCQSDTHNTNMVTVVKPVPYLNTAAMDKMT